MMMRIIEGLNEFANSGKDEPDLTFYQFVIDSLPAAVITVNSEFNITGFNPWAQKVTGYAAEEAIGSYCGDILQSGLCRINCPLKTVLNSKNPVVRIETTIRNRWGVIIPVRMNAAGLLDHDGKLIGGVEALFDISHVKALQRERDNLISMFAHDMKSPLISIQGFALRLLKTTDIGEEKQKKYLKIITNEADKLEFLINDFLEFSRLQTGKLTLDFSTTSLDNILLELYEAYKPKATKRGIKLELRNAEVLPIIEADDNRLHRVFTNLLDNALKFSEENGTITITTRKTDDGIMIKIIDQGTGIDPKELPYIFDPFHRGQSAESSDGYGVGLAVVKAIVEGHGGRVLVQSQLGKGSVFTVVLPKLKKPEKPIISGHR
jgi:two-component system phosphate regulon sensor histidine kinase PhoR